MSESNNVFFFLQYRVENKPRDLYLSENDLAKVIEGGGRGKKEGVCSTSRFLKVSATQSARCTH